LKIALGCPAARIVRMWLWSIAAVTLLIVATGGITRLTHSGLSIVDWDPLMGVVPPLSETQWENTFERYRQFPEYQQLRRGMTLGEFKFIFFWEYLHRLLARSIGVVFAVPFVIFLSRGWLTRPLAARALVLLGLGASQAVMGWLMVKSGLVDRPSVSHFRLAAHLVLAVTIFGYSIWLARSVTANPGGAGRLTAAPASTVASGLVVIGALLGLQIVWGAFVAGLKAGFIYNTFPLMGAELVPGNLLAMDPWIANFVRNPTAVQWTHRVLGTVLLTAAVAFFFVVRRRLHDPFSRRLNAALVVLVGVQYTLGVLTLLLVVPIPLGVAHQVTALLIAAVWVVWMRNLFIADL
jgi:cytochrome c oxidase assembly protein subunit 15